ncbi:unannotated protein [freshwater metagenome]|uniref:Unannotated protein n=1 Tax=freshwater metagenome TaxID=449393 RepID=A0A6J6MS31_9ZZZZ
MALPASRARDSGERNGFASNNRFRRNPRNGIASLIAWVNASGSELANSPGSLPAGNCATETEMSYFFSHA